ncbi:MAG: Uncharacterised protein [Euryarchaeota archaeon UBA443]|nr:MAG: Uncharacterised protein [Euryarchaeota archaeon UBA443]
MACSALSSSVASAPSSPSISYSIVMYMLFPICVMEEAIEMITSPSSIPITSDEWYPSGDHASVISTIMTVSSSRSIISPMFIELASTSYMTVIPKDSLSSTVTKSLIFSSAMSSLTSIFIVSPSSEDVSSVHPASRSEATIRRASVLFIVLTSNC